MSWFYELPHLVTNNCVKICLVTGNDGNNLTVNGNDFRLTGEFNDVCRDDKWAILSGTGTTNGNNATFENIKFN